MLKKILKDKLLLTIVLLNILLFSFVVFYVVNYIAAPYIFYERNGVLGYINKERLSRGLVPLRRNALLERSARLKAEDETKKDYFEHYTPDGKFFVVFVSAAGYKFDNAGEILGRSYYDDKELFDAWMKSPTHKKQIIDPRWTEAGFAREGKYSVVHFGQPRPF